MSPAFPLPTAFSRPFHGPDQKHRSAAAFLLPSRFLMKEVTFRRFGPPGDALNRADCLGVRTSIVFLSHAARFLGLPPPILPPLFDFWTAKRGN